MELTQVGSLTRELKDNEVLIRGRVHAIRAKGKKMAFLFVREGGFTVQCLASLQTEGVTYEMVNFIAKLNRESIVDVIGVVSIPENPIKGTTQEVEILVTKFYCDTRLDFRVLDLRTPANRGIFRIQSQVQSIFSQFLLSEDFVQIHTPKILAGSSEGGSAVFTLNYKGQLACLAQSPQLHKQMAICADFKRVFEIGHVFRAEDSYTHRHLCEFIGLDVEMEIKDHYSELMDMVDRLFVTIFDGLNERCGNELEAVRKQYPFEPLRYTPNTLRLTFEEGVEMLKDAGVEVDPLGDLNTEAERKLGQLVLEKYDTEFYILHRFPLALELLEERAKACGIDVETISSYLDSFRYGVPPHGGFGAGLERVVMLFCGLNNIRKTSLFPRDPRRLVP
ncbi:Aspartyl/Asparaginyl-tRNA synthetase, class IIb [Corchorus olitorius]|uniref:aspartate--tRNA ligase n=1 Tax=Corchorus olitorius TaxID=93759 RepID=A0A1R3J5F5_9ROSI|nr:Aspartyl/Asparaginyl-tRNA synthetase, class IIb [Corchorus olitorius]